MDKRRVVITGIGTVNPLANNAPDTWEAVKAGKCGIGMVSHFDTTDFKVKVGAEVKDFSSEGAIDPKEARRMDLFMQYALVAAKEAMDDSGLDMDKEDQSKAGCIVSSGIGGFKTIEDETIKAHEKGYSRVSPFFIPMIIGNMAPGQIAINYKLKGMCTCVITACASSNNAIGDAFHRIRDGYETIMVAGGSEAAITPLAMGGFQSMKALNTTDDPTKASIPFDAERAGFVMGEGAGILVLEEYEHAKARGAKMYAEVVGYGSSCDAHHITAPHPEGEGGAACMVAAIEDAGLTPNDIDYINAHGTSTHMNDACETMAIKKALGDHAKDVMVSSTKSMTGHLLGAAGAVEAIISAKALQDGFVPATIGYKTKDPECDLDIVPNEGRKADIKVALSNALGFGGHNASIVLKKI